MKFFLVLSFLVVVLAGDDVKLYQKLKQIKDQKEVYHKDGDTKVVIKNPQDTNLTKSVKMLLKQQKIAQKTSEFKVILKD